MPTQRDNFSPYKPRIYAVWGIQITFLVFNWSLFKNNTNPLRVLFGEDFFAVRLFISSHFTISALNALLKGGILIGEFIRINEENPFEKGLFLKLLS